MKKLHNAILKSYASGRRILIISERPFGSGKRGVKEPELEDHLTEFPNDPDEVARRSLARTKQTLHDIVFSNVWDLFVTVTFDKTKVDRYNYDAVVEEYSKLLKNIKRRIAPDMEYVFVPEHHKDGAIHFHGLLRQIGSLRLKDSRRRDKSGNVIYNLSDFDLGFNTATKVNDTGKVSTYLMKYISKDLIQTLGESRKRYWCSQGLNRVLKETTLLTPAEQLQFLYDHVHEYGQKKGMTVSAKTVIVDKAGYKNKIHYIIYQDYTSESETNANICSA